MKRMIGFLTVGVFLLLTGCSGDGYTPALRAIDSVINEKPDSALCMLDSLSTEVAAWSKSQRMRYSLLTLKAQNKADVTFTSDSVAKVLVDFFDSRGTTNERMQAHFFWDVHIVIWAKRRELSVVIREPLMLPIQQLQILTFTL